jgi:hypothetical protein|tara:strand:+ start:201 stop:437 length:237 start_codon:yes stop_codon:yes gene_type:complete
MDTKNYNTLIYNRGSSTKEAKSIKFDLPEGMTCAEFKVICIRMAHAIGYHDNSVREQFGSISDANIKADKEQLKLLFD